MVAGYRSLGFQKLWSGWASAGAWRAARLCLLAVCIGASAHQHGGLRAVERLGYTQRVTNATTQARLLVTVIPSVLAETVKAPTLILVPRGDADASMFVGQSAVARELAGLGFTTVAFDPDGRGWSEGHEDQSGFKQQDGLAAVIRWALSRPEVDTNQVGVISFASGLNLAAGALARHPDLPIRFLIDWEGPADRGDAGGRDLAGNDVSARLTGVEDERFWAEREAFRWVTKLRVPYLRLQAARARDPRAALPAWRLINAALRGGVPEVRLNQTVVREPVDPNRPPTLLPEDSSPQRTRIIARCAHDLLRDYGARPR